MSPRFTKAPPQTGLPETESSVLKGQLTKLGLHSMAATFEAEADRAAKSETSFTAYLGRLVELELADKADRSINARIARARFDEFPDGRHAACGALRQRHAEEPSDLVAAARSKADSAAR
jgi:hypothetical protein